MRRFIFVGLLMLSLPGTSTHAQVEIEPNHQFELEEVLSIGDDESAPPEYLFSNPAHVRTDGDGRIYVVEQRGKRIRVFSHDGTFLGALGRSGGGPGEFEDIQAIAIDSEGRLVVYDRMLQRFTRFPPLEQIESLPRPDREKVETFQKEYRVTPDFMYGLPDGRFVLFYQPPRGHRSLDQPRLHVYNHRFEKVSAFGVPTNWNLPDDEFSQELVRNYGPFEGSHVAPGTSSLLLSPELYRGILYQYVPANNDAWTLQRIEGRDPGHPTHEIVPCDEDANWSHLLSGGPCARHRSTSRGIGRLSDGRVVHLSTAEDEDGVRQLQLELFSPDGTLQKIGPIEGFGHDETEFEAVKQAVLVQLLWVDRRDRLYLEDRRSGFPVIRVAKFDERALLNKN